MTPTGLSHIEHHMYNVSNSKAQRFRSSFVEHTCLVHIVHFNSKSQYVLHHGELLWPGFVRRASSVVRRASSVNFFYLNIFSSKTTQWMLTNLTGMIPGWSPTKVVKMVLIGLISRSRGQKIGFQNAIFKNLLVWN